ncbi:AN1-type zinc finger protein 4-like isoform X1 [Vanessa atalanta]|uniref:AN1-type zinc finger protein 4-like isoform X1 n=1 Tax=Vanessa atalanta TaxID=42275 RepID=UPI001FCE09F1|nr:AN1-type zinc finger protein 4-like isoform X1 [Vanessa atalanta]
MSQHGCPERLSNRSKGFQEDGTSQPTMEVLVETLTGTAFEMTVSPSDTIFAIKSKIFRVEGIPVSQQHLLYNLRELDDARSLREHAVGDGARLRLVLGLRGGPVSTRRLPPADPLRDIERFLYPNRSDEEEGERGCKATVLVFREGERVNLVRVRENRDGTYSPLERAKYSSSPSRPSASGATGGGGEGGALRDNAVTLGKMLELRRRMETLSVRRRADHRHGEAHDIQKTRSEETLSAPSLLEDAHFAPLYDGRYTRYDYDCSFADRYTLLPPIATRADSDQSIQDSVVEASLSEALAGSILVKAREDEPAILEECDDPEPLAADLPAEYGAPGGAWRARGFGSSCALAGAPPPAAPRHARFSSSTSDLEQLKRNRMLPALSRHRNREHLHLSDDGLDLRPARRAPPATPAPPAAPAAPASPRKAARARCGLCRKRLSVATEHRCRCGAQFCAPHRYAEVHGCAYDYKADAPRHLRRDNPLVSAPKLPKI